MECRRSGETHGICGFGVGSTQRSQRRRQAGARGVPMRALASSLKLFGVATRLAKGAKGPAAAAAGEVGAAMWGRLRGKRARPG